MGDLVYFLEQSESINKEVYTTIRMHALRIDSEIQRENFFNFTR